MRIGVIAVPGTFDSALTCVLDVLASAESLRASVDEEIPQIPVGEVDRRVRHHS